MQQYNDSDGSDNDAPMEISLKNKKPSKNDMVIKARPVQKQPKKAATKNKMKKQILANLKEKFEEEKMLEELKNVEIDFGVRQNKVIQISEPAAQKKAIPGLDIEVFRQVRREERKPVNRMMTRLEKANDKRGDIRELIAFKRSRRN